MIQRSNKRGFTLIEILVALVIASVLSLILYFSFSGIATTSAALTGYSERYRQAVISMNQLASDLTGAFFSSSVPFSSFSVTEKLVMDGKFAQISFSSFSRQFTDGETGGTDLIKVTYRPVPSDEGDWVEIYREVELNPQIPGFSGTLKEPLLTGVTSFSARAVMGNDDGLPEWDTEEKMRLPERLAVSLTFRDGLSINREYYLNLTGDSGLYVNSGKRKE